MTTKSLNTCSSHVAEILEWRAQEQGEKRSYLWLAEDGREIEWTYAGLYQEAAKIAGALLETATPGDRVLLLYSGSPHFIPAFYACMLAGLIAVPANPPRKNRNSTRLGAILRDCGARLALCNRDALPALSQMLGSEGLSWIASDQIEAPARQRPLPEPKEGIAFLQYTSGSTGDPKGVMVSHANLAHNVSLIAQAFNFNAQSVMVSWLPTFHDMGLIHGMLSPLCHGFPAVMMPPAAFLGEPLKWLRAISKYKGTHGAAPNFAFELCTARAEEALREGLDLSSMAAFQCGAEPIRKQTLEQFMNRFAPCGLKSSAITPAYGLAESTVYVSGGPLGEGLQSAELDRDALEKLEWKPGETASLVACGQALGQEILIVDPQTLQASPPGQLGEVWIRGASVAAGYWNKPQETQKTFGATLASGEGPYLRSGDLGYLHEGRLHIGGRLKDLIIIRGVNYFPQDIEAAAQALSPDLKAGGGAAFSVDGPAGEELVLVQEVARHPKTPLEALRTAVMAEVFSQFDLRIKDLVFVQQGCVPKTSSGKIQRSFCREMLSKGSFENLLPKMVGVEAHFEDKAPLVIALQTFLAGKGCGFSDLETRTIDELALDSLETFELKHHLDKILGLDIPIGNFQSGRLLKDLTLNAQRSQIGTHEETGFASTSQHAMLSLLERHQKGAPYNVGAAWLLEGRWDTPEFLERLQKVVQAHPALRMGFKKDSRGWSTHVSEKCPVEIKQVRLNGEMDLQNFLLQEISSPFNLSKPPLIRVSLGSLIDGKRALIIVAHHVVVDGWSFRILCKELSRFCSESSPPRKLLTAPSNPNDLSWWSERVSRTQEPICWPEFDEPVFEIGSPAKTEYFSFPAELAEKFNRFAETNNISRAALALAAVRVTLSKLTGQLEFSIGVPFANRSAAGLGDVVGYFVNALPLSQALDMDSTFLESAMSTAELLKEGMSHDSTPLAELPLPAGRVPYSCLFSWQGETPVPDFGPDTKVTPLFLPSGGAKTDFAMTFETFGSEIRACIETPSRLFHAGFVAWFGKALQKLLANVMENPSKKLAAFKLLPRKGQHEALRLSRGARRLRSGSSNVVRLFERMAKIHPAQIAVYGQKNLSYSDLHLKSNQLANLLASWGIGKGDVVPLLFDRCPEWVVAILGVLKAGAAFCPMDRDNPPARIISMLDEIEARVILCDEKIDLPLGPLGPIQLNLKDSSSKLSHYSVDEPVFMAMPSDLAYVLFTSGSTGRPKGVMVEHSNLLNHSLAASGYMNVKAGERILQLLSPGFDASLEAIFPALISGASIVMGPGLGYLDFDRLAALINTTGANHLPLPTAWWASCVPTGCTAFDKRLVTLKTLIVGGDSPLVSQASNWLTLAPKSRFLHAYGPTEATVISTLFEVSRPWLEKQASNARIPIGRPIENVSCLLIGGAGVPASRGEAGEIWIGGAGVARGYLKSPAGTATSFVKRRNRRYYRSGDLARWNGQGQLEFLGRKDNQVKVNGVRLELAEVESALVGLPGVRSAVAGVDEVGHSKILKAFLVGESKLDCKALLKALAKILPVWMLPTVLKQVDVLPLVANGKLDRGALKRQEELQPKIKKTDDKTEKLVVNAIARLLGLENLTSEANFFELGGNSLLAMQLSQSLREATGKHFDVKHIFDSPCICDIARNLNAAEEIGGEIQALAFKTSQENLPSLGQEALWTLEKMYPGTPAYHVVWTCEIKGALDVEKLRLVLNEIFLAQPSLRTVFQEFEGNIRAVDCGTSAMPFEYSDIELFGSMAGESVLKELMAKLYTTPFDLSRGPLCRATLVRLAPRQHQLAFAFHHLICDGRGLSIFLNALKNRYSGKKLARLGQDDFSQKQRSWITSPHGEEAAEYWKMKMRGKPGSLGLPLTKKRAKVAPMAGYSLPFELEPKLVTDLKNFCRARGFTAHEVLFSAWLCWLARFSGQEAPVCGVPFDGGLGTDKGRIGLYMNMLPLSVSLEGCRNFLELMNAVRRECSEAYRHGAYPFERIMRGWNGAREEGVPPLVQCVFGLVAATHDFHLGACTVKELQTNGVASKLDLSLFIVDHGSHLKGQLEISEAVGGKDFARAISNQYQSVLADAIKFPESSWKTLSLGVHAGVSLSVPPNYPSDMGVHALVQEMADKFPSSLAVRSEKSQITYGELNSEANRLARYLQSLELKLEEPVVLLCERSPEMVIAMLAVFKAGGAYVPLDPEMPDTRIGLILEDTGARFVLCDRQQAPRLIECPVQLIILDSPNEEWKLQIDDNLTDRGDPERLAYLMYTSGSTGTPKAVEIIHRGIQRIVCDHGYLPLRASDVIGQVTSQAFDLSVNEIWAALCHGCSLEIISKRALLQAETFRSALLRGDVSVLIMSSAIFNHLAAQDPTLFASLSHLVLGGEVLDMKWVRMVLENGRPGRLLNAYGPTECTVWSTFEVVDSVPEHAISISIGRPLGQDQAYVLGPSGELLPTGIKGELYLGGAGVGRGYWKRPDLTRERFVPGPYPGTGMIYRTGDLARWLPDGRLEFFGRADFQVKIDGHRIELGELEAVLVSCAGIKTAVILPYKDDSGHLKLCAVLEAQHESSFDLREVTRCLRSNLPAYMFPAEFRGIKAVPLTTSGKIDRKELERLRIGLTTLRHPADTSEESIHAGEREVLEIMREALGNPGLGADDRFFDAGGSSLAVVDLLGRMERRLGIGLAISDFLSNPSARDLACVMFGNQIRGSEIKAVPLNRENGLQTLIFFHPIGGSVLCYGSLVRAMGSMKILGIESPALLGHKPYSTLEEMISASVGAVRALHLSKPPLFVGWSFGGILASETAKRIGGAMAVVLDSGPPDPREFELLRDPLAMAKFLIRDAMKGKPSTRIFPAHEYLSVDLEQKMKLLSGYLDMHPATVERVIRTIEGNLRCAHEWKPVPAFGRVVQIKAKLGEVEDWPGAKIMAAEGDHFTMLEPPYVAGLAEMIKGLVSKNYAGVSYE